MEVTRKISLKYGKDTVTLRVNPDSITLDYPQTSKKADLLEGGYLTMGEKGLMTVNIETFLPNDDSVFAGNNPARTMSATVNLLRDWKEKKRQVCVTIQGVCTKYCYITNYSTTYKEGDEDVYFKLGLTEYRKLSAEKVVRKPAKKPETEMQVYTVKKGDNLTKIARRFGTRWENIYAIAENKKVIGSNPNLIFPGQKLKIPSK